MAYSVVHSTCALDCPDACSLLVTIDGTTGKATRLRGNPEHPVTRGFLCAKVTRYLEREYSSDRLLYPQRRVGAKGEARFERITWDQALEEIARRLQRTAREFGPESILPYSYAGTMGILQNASMDRRFFHRLGASRLDRTICSSAGGAALMRTLGARLGTEPEQVPMAKLIIAWGANIMGTNVHLWPFIVEARRKGARFYTIDPMMNRTGRLADRHFFINPGTDTALALGMMHVIIGEKLYDAAFVDAYTNGFDGLRERAAGYTPERVEALTGVPRADVVALAREYATTRPALIRLGYGPQRSERGGAAISAIVSLAAITGAFQHPGGGALLSTSMAFDFDRRALERPDLGPPARTLNMSQLGHALTEVKHPPVKALFVYNSNPAAIAPSQNDVLKGLRREDLFTVVAEQFMTDTARYADIVLPATTFLEHTDIYLAYGHYHLQLAKAALPAPGECKRNTEVFRLLAARMGLDDPCLRDSDEAMIDQALGSGSRFFEGIDRSRLEREHSVRLNISAPGTPFRPHAKGWFGTRSGKCELLPEELDYKPPIESRLGDANVLARYPLEMISPKNDDSMNSTFGYRPEQARETSTLFLHGDDAAARGISDGDRVRVFNQRGSVLYTASVDGVVPPGVVSGPAVGWGTNANALVSERLTDIGAGATFYSCLVQVERCGD